jgi:hypothetical protein
MGFAYQAAVFAQTAPVSVVFATPRATPKVAATLELNAFAILANLLPF